MTKIDQYEALCREIWHHNKLYYIDHTPVISDEEFDALLRRLEEMEKEHPEWVTAVSPTQRVGESLTSGFKTIEHTIPMLSLANTYSKEEIVDFIQRVSKLLDAKQAHFSAELKMDGIAITAVFERGIFTRAVTRGDGKSGDDITMNVRTISMLPLQLVGESVPEFLEVRGEVFMPRSVFQRLNQEKEADGEELMANPRNAAAGSLKLLDPKEVSRRSLAVVFYGIADCSGIPIKKQTEIFPYLQSLGLPILQYTAPCQTIDEIWEFAEKVLKMRRSLPFDIDGIVIKLDDIKDQKRLGETNKNPRWAIAYKFAAEQSSTIIKQITVQVGRTGVLTPVAELKPVLLAGSTIARATLHNEDEVKRKDIRVGDHVIIEKGGDVIPKVVSVILEKRPSESMRWNMPEVCPSCQTPVVRVEGEVAVRCPNEEGCPDQQIRRLIFFASKDAMDIHHMGEKVVIQLFEKGFVRRPSDIYRLTEKEISQLSGFKSKSVQNLLESIEKSKSVDLSRFLLALEIKYVGAGTAEVLAAKAGSVYSLMKMKEEDLKLIDGVGDKVAHALTLYFSESAHIEELERLLQYGVKPIAMVIKTFDHHLFGNKIFVLTGSLEHFTRTSAAALIKERGGKVTDSVSKKTDYLIVGLEPGSKLDKAKALGVKVLNETEFMELI